MTTLSNMKKRPAEYFSFHFFFTYTDALIGLTCTTSSTDECVTGAAACPATGTLECQCPANFVPKSDNTKCCK